MSEGRFITEAHPRNKAERDRRNAFAHHEAMADAEALCVPCKLCGGKAVIRDAGIGWGYTIECENVSPYQNNNRKRKPECMCGALRVSGWAYNVMEAWNLLHRPAPAQDAGEVARHSETIRAIEIMLSRLKWNPDHERALRGHLENERRARAALTLKASDEVRRD